MKSTSTPLFTNSCGRVFANHIQLSSYRGETTVKVADIAAVSFKRIISRKGILLALLPSVLIVVSFFVNQQNPGEKYTFLIAGIMGMVVLFATAERKQYVHINFHKKPSKNISVKSHSIKEAKRYVSEASKVINSFNAKNVQQQEQASFMGGTVAEI